MKRLLPSPSMGVALLALFVALGGTGYAVATIDSADVQNNSLRSADLKNNSAVRSRDVVDGTLRCKDFNKRTRESFCSNEPGPQGDAGDRGPAGPTGGRGEPGATGLPGDDALTRITELPGPGFDATNASCSMTPDGVECGPYADGGAEGGSLYYDGLNGQTLADVKSLIYRIRYQSDGDTGGVGVPYLRVFLEGDAHDAIFSPNTQSPDADVAEGPFHAWVATSGSWRYDDDPGVGADSAFADIVAAHGTEVISGIYVTTGFSAGANLKSLLRSLEVNGENFAFGG